MGQAPCGKPIVGEEVHEGVVANNEGKPGMIGRTGRPTEVQGGAKEETSRDRGDDGKAVLEEDNEAQGGDLAESSILHHLFT